MSNGSMLRGILLAISVAILGPSAFGAGGAAAKKEAAKQVVDGKINTGVATIATVEEVFLALQTFQTSVREHLIAAEASFRAVRASAISTLADAGITNTEDYPKDLLVRGGGASDQIESDVAKEVEKIEKEARKRARAAAERFESELDIAVGIDLRSPATFLTPPAELMGVRTS